MNESESLKRRLDSEKEFHDAKYSGGDLFPRHYSANPTARIYDEMLESLGDLADQTVLEYGCGDGWCTVDLCKAGGVVDSFDISSEAVESARKNLIKEGFNDASSRIRVAAAEALPYTDNHFDVAFGFAILHHLDLPAAIPELLRVLKPGGFGVFAEPLQGNPLLRLYRKMTPQFRTPDEEPFLISSLGKVFTGFSSIEHKEYFLLGQLALASLYVPGIRKLYPMLHRSLWRADNRILTAIPRAGSWAWYSVIVVRK